jgi:hypothetical protein
MSFVYARIETDWDMHIPNLFLSGDYKAVDGNHYF